MLLQNLQEVTTCVDYARIKNLKLRAIVENSIELQEDNALVEIMDDVSSSNIACTLKTNVTKETDTGLQHSSKRNPILN